MSTHLFSSEDHILYKDPETGEYYPGVYDKPCGIPGMTSRITVGAYRVIVPTQYILPRSAEVFLDPSKMRGPSAPDVDMFVQAAEEQERKMVINGCIASFQNPQDDSF